MTSPFGVATKTIAHPGRKGIMRHQRIHVRAGAGANKGHCAYGIGVPWQIAELLNPATEYDVELTQEGILFKPVCVPKVPAWVNEQNGRMTDAG